MATLLKDTFAAWEKECEDRFLTLKANEEKLNRIFIDIYGLADELSPELEDKDVTVRKASLSRDIKSLLSYAVGCMFGRYSLDVEGLAYAGGEWDEGKYKSFKPVTNNILLILDESRFPAIASSFVQFIETVYGKETWEENLAFIAGALGGRGTPQEVIHAYFQNDFFKDHCKIYQKRPVYWLFDAGKENSFKALVYLHRYNADTIGKLRVEYLQEVQKYYEMEIAGLEKYLQSNPAASDRANNQKRLEKLQRQLREIRAYDEKLAPLADMRIEIDLDDGVKFNYAKIQTLSNGKNLNILPEIK